jgi:hypothetical protein
MPASSSSTNHRIGSPRRARAKAWRTPPSWDAHPPAEEDDNPGWKRGGSTVGKDLWSHALYSPPPATIRNS